MFAWYWIADLCEKHEIDFVLGHALYMRAIYGAKMKNDRQPEPEGPFEDDEHLVLRAV